MQKEFCPNSWCELLRATTANCVQPQISYTHNPHNRTQSYRFPDVPWTVFTNSAVPRLLTYWPNARLKCDETRVGHRLPSCRWSTQSKQHWRKLFKLATPLDLKHWVTWFGTLTRSFIPRRPVRRLCSSLHKPVFSTGGRSTSCCRCCSQSNACRINMPCEQSTLDGTVPYPIWTKVRLKRQSKLCE